MEEGKKNVEHGRDDDDTHSGSFGTVFTFKDNSVFSLTGSGRRDDRSGGSGGSGGSGKSISLPPKSPRFGTSSPLICRQKSPALSATTLPSATTDMLKNLFKTASPHANMGLKLRCGFGQKKNNRKEMEDYVTICPAFSTDLQKDRGHRVDNSEEVSFFGVYDGHSGGYVAQYLSEHLRSRFEEQLKFNRNSIVNCESDHDESTGTMDSLMKLDCIVRISFKEAVSKVDREILKADSERLSLIKSRREAALAWGDVPPGDAPLGTDKFAGSCAVVAIVYHSRNNGVSTFSPTSSNSPHYQSLSPNALQQHTNQMKSTAKRKICRKTSTGSSSEEDAHSASASVDLENDAFFEGGVKVLNCKNSAGSVLSDLTTSFRISNRQRGSSLSNVLTDESQMWSLKMGPKHTQIMVALRENCIEDLTKYDSDEINDVAMDMKRRASELQRHAEEYNHFADYLQQMCLQRKTGLNGGDSDVSSICSQSKGSSIASSALTPRTPTSVSSTGSLTSLKSFGDMDRINFNRNVPLATVTEGRNESRQTSFATSHMQSKGSFLSAPDVVEKQLNACILIGHVGDCRAVLSDRGIAILLTVDHSPTQEDEMTRIKCAGGFISNKRVNGILDVSRAFGDIKFKAFKPGSQEPDSFMDEETSPDGIWNSRNAVISMPDILELQILPSYEFIILASDGLWNSFTISESVQFVRAQLIDHGDVERATQELIAATCMAGAVDNVSVVIICLNQV